MPWIRAEAEHALRAHDSEASTILGLKGELMLRNAILCLKLSEALLIDYVESSGMKVLFTGRELRVRRRETIEYPPKGVSYVTQFPIKEMPPDHDRKYGYVKPPMFPRLHNFLNYGNFIPKRFLKGVDLIHSSGKIILNRKPWVVEVDNVAVLAYYNLTVLKLFKPVIRHYLRSSWCRGIVCLSEAGKRSVDKFFRDPVIKRKLHVVYPYVKEQKKSTGDGLLFVSTKFYLKGGRELVRAFCKSKTKMSLTIITKRKDIKDEEFTLITGDKRIRFVEANLEKKELYNYYQKNSVFLMPSYQDSFGLVYLEALACGLALIGTNSFAIPEMIEKNGLLIEPPMQYFKDDLPNPEWWYRVPSYSREHSFPKVEKKLIKIIDSLTQAKIKRMQEESRKLVKEKFSEEKRKKTLLCVYEQ